MARRLIRVVTVQHHAGHGPLPSSHGVTVIVAAHPRVPRWLVLRAARAETWSMASAGRPAVLVKREMPGRPTAWEISWFPPPAPTPLDQPQEPTP